MNESEFLENFWSICDQARTGFHVTPSVGALQIGFHVTPSVGALQIVYSTIAIDGLTHSANQFTVVDKNCKNHPLFIDLKDKSLFERVYRQRPDFQRLKRGFSVCIYRMTAVKKDGSEEIVYCRNFTEIFNVFPKSELDSIWSAGFYPDTKRVCWASEQP